MEDWIELNWIIKAEALNLSQGKFIESDSFQTTIPNLNYKFCFYPHGYRDEQPHVPELAIFATSDAGVKAKIMITTPSATNAKFEIDTNLVKWEDNCHYSTGLILPLNFKDLDEVIKTGKLTLQFRGTLKKRHGKRKFPFESNPLREILWDTSDKDFTLIVGDRELKVHKFLMAARSLYFQALLASPWIENQENKATVQGFSFEVVEKAVKFIYDFPLIITSTNEALDLFNFAEYYNIIDLKTEAEKYLIAQIRACTVCELANASMKCNAGNLRLSCINFLLKCQKNSSPVCELESLDPEFNAELIKRIFCTIQKS